MSAGVGFHAKTLRAVAFILAIALVGCGGGGGGGGGGNDNEPEPGATSTPVPQRTTTPNIQPTPNPTPTSVVNASVCGGAITSTPKLCNLAANPSSTTTFGSFTLEVSMSDLEGDIDKLCVGIGLASLPFPVVSCRFVTPSGRTINTTIETDAIRAPTRSGTYIIALSVGDSAGNTSGGVSTTLQVF